MTFADLGLSDELLRAIGESGYTEPTPIQAGAIPPVLMNRDLIGIAQTGTGKTASFVLPMIDVLAHGRARAMMPRSLILEPTRELAAQVAENFEKYGKYHKLSMALLIGGTSMGDQQKALAKGVDVLIATPGRLMDLFGRGKILLSGCSILVIDEADRMLDMGFIPDIEEICSKLPATRQTLLFSATMPAPIKKLADKFLSNPKQVEVSRPATTNTLIEQRLVETSSRGKREALRAILAAEDVRTAIIFSNRKTTVRELSDSLRRDGMAAGQIHGDMEQAERIKELDRFKAGEINILVASDVAARGLDIKGVSHVVNYDVPWHADDYVHRIGRTGRAGASGKAFTLVTPDDGEAIEAIEKLQGTKIERVGGGKPAEARATAPVAAPVEAEEPRGDRKRGRGRREKPKSEAPREVQAPREEIVEAVPEQPAAEAPPGREPREARPPRQAREPRPERARRDEPGRDEPRREEHRREQPRRDHRADRDDGPDVGWNGPVPSFLEVSFGLAPEA
ncbi:DEAD/DEAH box helicase [Sphingomonas sp. BIUV-7]|uniref:DEAD/DEAH box helicase n=1 Tax=Sphingomonas natans TaxID=3063330 RepID=A0ABT8Y5Z9_9SPHN|nr:DEAD/DEAH box helicase [Sphingomonas sp. BIUV-7]MDO6413746.1 DEAD/DEAH box helicase [Sphingomonas sp. BIUV-7]